MKEKKILLETIITSALISGFVSLLVTSPIIYSMVRNERESKRMVKEFIAGREERYKSLEAQSKVSETIDIKSLNKNMVKIDKLLVEKKHKAEIDPTKENIDDYLQILTVAADLHRAAETVRLGGEIK